MIYIESLHDFIIVRNLIMHAHYKTKTKIPRTFTPKFISKFYEHWHIHVVQTFQYLNTLKFYKHLHAYKTLILQFIHISAELKIHKSSNLKILQTFTYLQNAKFSSHSHLHNSTLRRHSQMYTTQNTADVYIFTQFKILQYSHTYTI